LEAYGAFDMAAYTVNHPFEGLFMFGGAKEMSVDQVLETGLYIGCRRWPCQGMETGGRGYGDRLDEPEGADPGDPASLYRVHCRELAIAA
jgi:hypothetical protein